MTDKTVNYTDEMVAALHDGYDGTASEDVRDAQVLALGEQLGKSAASIRAKLTREQLYVPKVKAPAGKAVVRKSVIVAEIAEKMGVDEDIIGSLEKATKFTLVRILNALS